MNDISGQIDRIENKVLALEQASRCLLNKLDRIFNSEEYLSIFTIAMVHGITYRGENCSAELEHLRKVLS